MHAPAQEAVVVVQGGQQHWALGTSDERRYFSVMHNWGKVLWSDPGAYNTHRRFKSPYIHSLP